MFVFISLHVRLWSRGFCVQVLRVLLLRAFHHFQTDKNGPKNGPHENAEDVPHPRISQEPLPPPSHTREEVTRNAIQTRHSNFFQIFQLSLVFTRFHSFSLFYLRISVINSPHLCAKPPMPDFFFSEKAFFRLKSAKASNQTPGAR